MIAVPGNANAAALSASTSPRATAKASVPSASVRAELANLETKARATFGRTSASATQQPGRSGSITGHLVGPNELPIPGACVTAVGRSGTVTASAAANGAFRIGGLAAGSYALEYRDCSAPGSFLTRWSGPAATLSTAARIRVTAGGQNRVPTMTLMSTNPAANMPNQATWRKMLAAAAGQGLSADAAANTGRISGVVTGGGHRLHGICVQVFPVQGGFGYGATTSTNGTYTVRHVKPGRYDVTFAPFFDCASDGNWLQQIYRGHNTPFPFGGNAVRVVSGKATKHINAALRLGGAISGTVRSASGQRLRGICVNVNGRITGGFEGIELPTSRRGTYHLHGLFPGKYSFQFSTGCGNRGNYAPATHRPIKIHGQVVKGVNATLMTGGTITGTVRLGSSSGTPLAGICVSASSSSGSFGNAETGIDGTYRIVGLATGRYQILFQAQCSNEGNYVAATATASATAGQVTSGVDGVMQPGAQISGVVTNEQGKPVANLCINFGGPGTEFANISGTLDDGSYLINQIPAGTYELGFFSECGNSGSYAPYWYNNQTNESLASPIALAAGESQVINAVMQPGVTISGTVTDAAGGKLSRICVFAATPFEAGLGGEFEQDAITGRHGRYSISNLAPGPYYVNFGCGLSTKYADRWYGPASNPAEARLLDLPPGRTSGIDAALQPAGSISGKVTGQAGRPLRNVCVSVYDTSTVSGPGPITSGGFLGPITSAGGVYKASGLPSGSYDLLFYQCLAIHPRYVDQWYRHAGSFGSATPVTVKAGANTPGVNVRLSIGGTISGHAFGAANNPLRNVCVVAFSDTNASFGFATTHKDGSYSISGLGTGRYFVEFEPCNDGNLVSVFATATVHAPRATTGINGTLVAGGSVAGTVTTAGQSSMPISFMCVDVLSSNPSNPGGLGETALDGTYLTTGLAPGSYKVLFDPTCLMGPALAPQWYNNKSSQATADSVVVATGQTTTGIDAALQPDGEITGTVQGPSATNVTGACVTAVPLSGQLFAPYVAVSKSGSYTLLQLPPGRYKVKFSSGCGATGYRTQWWQDAPTRQTAKIVRVPAGQTISGTSATLTQ